MPFNPGETDDPRRRHRRRRALFRRWRLWRWTWRAASAIPTESQVGGAPAGIPRSYLADEIAPSLARLGFASEIVENPVNQIGGRGGPMLIAERREEAATTTVFGYGHGDVIRGLEPQWREGLSPWELKQDGDRLYGRGTADNKGQHTINIAALDSVLQTRGRLGFNAIFLIETGEEIGSPGLREVCRQYKERLAALVPLIASWTGRASRPSGRRSSLARLRSNEFRPRRSNLRDGGHHSGNWGGLAGQSRRRSSHMPLGDDHDTARRDPGARVGADASARTRCGCAGRLPN